MISEVLELKQRGEHQVLQINHYWNRELYQNLWKFDEKASYSAGVAWITASRGMSPEIQLILENRNDPLRITQKDGRKGPHRRDHAWKCPIGGFEPGRDPHLGFDAHPGHTAIQEYFEETGVLLKERDLSNAPIVEYKSPSKRGHGNHIDRIYFYITPERPVPDEKVWKRQIELVDVCSFPLAQMPNATLESHKGASVKYSHVRRLVDFFEMPQTQEMKWERGIPDDISKTIRAHFEVCGYRF